MSFFEYVTAMDFIAAIAVFFLMHNVLVVIIKMVQVHALMSSSRGYSFSATWNVWIIAICSSVIYWHLFIPGPGV